MDNVEDCIDDRIRLATHLEEQNALIVALSSRVGFLEDELQDMDHRLVRVSRRPSTPAPRPPPVMIDLTDESEDEEHEVILVEDDDEELIGGPIEVEVQVHVETPPPQELLEALRMTPINEEETVEYNWEADLLVRVGMALPEYEDPPPY